MNSNITATPGNTLAKIIVILVLITILATLGSGLYFLMKDDQDSERMLRALTIRVALSVSLFGFLMLGYYMGWFQPNTHLPYQ